ncbi:neurotrypsin-like [Dendronephthya gigantea]|uniref:neurotrypsin-like n=1 Tax=Dendronephthya gigantea TaxID=151771 RepID=UPI00106D1180|nr:neurotrypsin-like [Dendronephthya gigantea]
MQGYLIHAINEFCIQCLEKEEIAERNGNKRAYKTLRLQGSLSENGKGRVEVFFNGQWGTICDDGWDFKDARVVCRQLGYQDAVRALERGQVPHGSGRIWLRDVGCKGMEQNLISCSHRGWGEHDCSHDEDAGVECVSTADTTLRLQGSLSKNGRGRVEVFFNGEWGTICDDRWDFKDARFVCRQLGYQDAVRAIYRGEVPDGSGRIWLDEVECKGMEQNLINCFHAGWGKHDCRHSEDAGVECVLAVHISLRLRGPLSENGTGRIEVFYGGQWGTICGNIWHKGNAGVICRQLGYGDAVAALSGNFVPDGSGRIWLDGVDCTGREKSLIDCQHQGQGWGYTSYNCDHSNDAGSSANQPQCILSHYIYYVAFRKGLLPWIIMKSLMFVAVVKSTGEYLTSNAVAQNTTIPEARNVAEEGTLSPLENVAFSVN